MSKHQIGTLSEISDALDEQQRQRRQLLRSVAAGAGLAALGSAVGVQHALAAPPKPKFDTPIITCDSATQTSITLKVCAQASGLPAGFSVQWMTQADYLANGGNWYLSDDSRLCKASFSGNANASRYNLGANDCTTIVIGELLIDNGASTNCPDGLVCGVSYVFRAFGHATSEKMRSNFTGDLICTTLSCGTNGQCTYTQGYWKTHGPVPTGNNSNEWPPAALPMLLGTINYTALELQSILDKPAAGNGLIILAHQLIAAKLNIANGADGTAVAAAIAAADALIGALVVPPVGAGSLAPGVTSALVTALTNYNEGATGPGHCD